MVYHRHIALHMLHRLDFLTYTGILRNYIEHEYYNTTTIFIVTESRKEQF